MMSPAPQSERGFTLIEVLLVLFIIALLLTIVAPTLAPLQRRIADESAQFELVALLRQARWWAIQSGRTCQVELTAGPEVPGGTLGVRNSAQGERDSAQGVRNSAQGVRIRAQVTLPSETARPDVVVTDDWAQVEMLPEIESMEAIPPAAGDRPKRLAVVFTPGGVGRDYVISLRSPGGAATRIEIRRPGGLVWLVTGDDSAGRSDGAANKMEEYWQAHYSP